MHPLQTRRPDPGHDPSRPSQTRRGPGPAGATAVILRSAPGKLASFLRRLARETPSNASRDDWVRFAELVRGWPDTHKETNVARRRSAQPSRELQARVHGRGNWLRFAESVESCKAAPGQSASRSAKVCVSQVTTESSERVMRFALRQLREHHTSTLFRRQLKCATAGGFLSSGSCREAG
jgi:hypothetical protein